MWMAASGGNVAGRYGGDRGTREEGAASDWAKVWVLPSSHTVAEESRRLWRTSSGGGSRSRFCSECINGVVSRRPLHLGLARELSIEFLYACLVDWFSTYGHAIEEETKSKSLIEHNMGIRPAGPGAWVVRAGAFDRCPSCPELSDWEHPRPNGRELSTSTK
nr:uncharacterized protein LOC123493356 [Aegilops tauschii subsp. strangulata]